MPEEPVSAKQYEEALAKVMNIVKEESCIWEDKRDRLSFLYICLEGKICDWRHYGIGRKPRTSELFFYCTPKQTDSEGDMLAVDIKELAKIVYRKTDMPLEELYNEFLTELEPRIRVDEIKKAGIEKKVQERLKELKTKLTLSKQL